MSSAAPDRRAIMTEALRKIDDLTARLQAAESADTEPIAVVGMGCRLPGGADSPDRYWTLLTDGASGIVRVPAARWDANAFYAADHTVPGTICNREGGFLTNWDADQFDAEFFGISPREAAGMDPQQRLLMEVAWEALEDAGITPAAIRGTQTAVYVGLTTNDYPLTFVGRLSPRDIDPYIPFGNASNFAAGRLSYFLGVNGPAVVVDTACSSSLVSIHLACQSLRRRESDNALAAGVNLMLSPENSIACSRWGMLAADGTCKAFDAGADGYVRSEGCGVVVLRRLSDALRDGDRVLAVIRGSGVNQDGASSGQTVPNGPAQQALIRRVLQSARLQPSDIDYIEAHGTGTPLGDPIELDALSEVFAERDGAAPLILGSVKTNLGHLESAAGIAGFIKTVLALHRSHIPKHLHFQRLSSHAGPGASRLTIASEAMDWPDLDRPRRAGVSSFGVSGTNAHVVLEQAPPAPEPADPAPAVAQPPVSTLLVSGKSPERVAALAGVLADWLEGGGAGVSLAEVAHTLGHHRGGYARFATVVAADHEQAVAGLRAVAGGHRAPGVVGVHLGVCRPGTVFVYSGQGSQWAGMGRQLLAQEPAFAAAVDELERDFVAQVGFSLREVLESGEPVEGIDRVQPVLVGVQLALTALWRSYGVHPDAVIGHSMGEVAAAVVAGALSPADGLKVIATRSRLMARLSGRGAMALLELDAGSAAELVGGYRDVTVAVYASPRQTVVAGPADQVDAVVAVVAGRDRLARRVEVDVASHHRIVDPILVELRSALADLSPRRPSIPVVTTAVETGEAVFDADYWCANLRNPVRFSQAVAAAGAEHGTFVEVSPHPVLTYAIDDTLGHLHHHSIATLQRDTGDTVTFHTNLNATHTLRPPQSVDGREPHVRIPTTPWQHTRHWIAVPDSPEPLRHNGTPSDRAPLAPGGNGVLDDWFFELAWPVGELAESTVRGEDPWVVFADADFGPELGGLLGEGTRVMDESVLDTGMAGDELTGVRYVLYAPSVPPAPLTGAAARRVFNAAKRLAATLAGMSSPPQLLVLTRNAQPVDEGDRANPAHAILWGLGRTLALENPEIWRGIVDVDAAVPAELTARYVRAEACAADGEDQVVYQAGQRRVPRLRRATPPVALTGLPGGTSHLVIGATGNIGPHLIRQLADMGAATIVAVSRRGGGRQFDELRTRLAARGVTLVDAAADAADEAAMTTLFSRFGADLPPLDGVYLAALAGGAGQVIDLSDDDVAAIFRPKVDALTVLHRLTLKTPVRRFVMFSSVTGVFGSRWLGHYTAAGAFADAFAYARRAIGLPATVIDWGLWKSWSDAQPATASAGLVPMPDDVAIRVLPFLLSPDAGVRPVVVAADWDRLAEAYRMRAPFRVVDELLAGDGAADSGVGRLAPRPGTLLGERATAQAWRARLGAGPKPYPGEHRVQGVDLVPAAVLLQTLASATAELGESAFGDVRFEYPVVVGQPRVIHVTSDAESISLSSSPAVDTPVERWIRHASARLTGRPEGDLAPSATAEAVGFDAAVAAELERAWGIEGRPYPWSISAHRAAPGELDVEIDFPEPSTVALVDAAVHVARLVDSTNRGLMFPAAAERVWLGPAPSGTCGSVQVRHRGGDNTDGFAVDILVKDGGGDVVVDIRGLRYAGSAPTAIPGSDGPTASAADRPEWSLMSAEDTHEQLQVRLRAILARELGMSSEAVRADQPFPELGLDSMMAMTVLRDAKALVGVELSATMLWNHPTIASLAGLLTEMLAPQRQSQRVQEPPPTDSSGSVLDALFDAVESGADMESVSVGSESGVG